ncbi:nickel/cobalt efflux transporter [Vogesella oryzae]|uniref:nickel/cobalt efflux transporter n=1 Tax=Vogesella oryzae TaxID=1735285 RepID=UPI001581B6D5|nr:nickel/cobalt efflux transporter [Vogesella oryzae]
MPPIADLIQQGSTNLWLFIPSAILLGALHGLEPGHSKTMMASFIIAIRGTIAQAVLLGLCAALSHSLVVWVLAAAALKFGNQFIAEQAEPYFMLLSGVIVIGVAIWMFIRVRYDDLAARAQRHAPHGGRVINTGHGVVELQVFEDGVPPRFRLYAYNHHMQPQAFDTGDSITLETLRPDGERQCFQLEACGDYLQSREEIPEPHQFEAVLSIGHGDHAHRFEVSFREHDHAEGWPQATGHHHGHHHHGHDHAHHHDHDHHHDHAHAPAAGGEYQDAHERAHAEDIQRRFAGRQVTTAQIAMFGLSGGLMPCPASVTILMICLHLKRFTLGAAMVASFSLGLAIALVSVGVIAAWGTRQVGKRFGNLGDLARKMPYLSSLLMMVVGAVMGIQGLLHIAA